MQRSVGWTGKNLVGMLGSGNWERQLSTRQQRADKPKPSASVLSASLTTASLYPPKLSEPQFWPTLTHKHTYTERDLGNSQHCRLMLEQPVPGKLPNISVFPSPPLLKDYKSIS